MAIGTRDAAFWDQWWWKRLGSSTFGFPKQMWFDRCWGTLPNLAVKGGFVRKAGRSGTELCARRSGVVLPLQTVVRGFHTGDAPPVGDPPAGGAGITAVTHTVRHRPACRSVWDSQTGFSAVDATKMISGPSRSLLRPRQVPTRLW